MLCSVCFCFLLFLFWPGLRFLPSQSSADLPQATGVGRIANQIGYLLLILPGRGWVPCSPAISADPPVRPTLIVTPA